MNENKGAKGGSRDRRLSKLFQKFKKIKLVKIEEEKKFKNAKLKDDKDKNVFYKSSTDLKEESLPKETNKPDSKIVFIQKKAGVSEKKDAKSVPESKGKIDNDGNIVLDHKHSTDYNFEEKDSKSTDKPIDYLEPKQIKSVQKDDEDKTFIVPKATKKAGEDSNSIISTENIKREKEPIITEEDPITDKEPISNLKEIHKPYTDTINEREIILESKIANELEKVVKDRKYELNKLITEFNILNKQSEDLIDTKDAIKTAEEIEELIRKLDILKQQFETILTSSNLDRIYNLEDDYISGLLQEYKNNFSKELDSSVLENLKSNDSYKSIMTRIAEFEKETDKLDNKLQDKLSELEIRDDEFLLMKNSVSSIDKSVNQLDYILLNSNYLLKDIEDKVNNCKNVTKKVEYITKEVDYNINKLLLVFLLTKNNPLIPTGIATFLRAQAMFRYIGSLFSQNVEKKVHYEVSIIDYENEINAALSDVSKLDSIINSTQEQLKSIKKNFEVNFSKYMDSIPEYRNIYSKLNQLDEYITEKGKDIKKSSEELNIQLQKNKNKIKEKEYLS